MFDVAPMSFDKDVIQCSATSIHTELNTLALCECSNIMQKKGRTGIFWPNKTANLNKFPVKVALLVNMVA